MVGTVYSGGVSGIEAFVVRVECDISDGFPGFEIVGNLGSEVRESKERVITALKNCGVSIPNKKVTVNLAPANLRKHDTGYDASIAVSILTAMGIIDEECLADTLVMGELMLSGEIGGARGILPIVKLARDKGIRTCLVPTQNAREAAIIDGIKIIAVRELTELIGFLKGDIEIEEEVVNDTWKVEECDRGCDLKNVSGQKVAKRGLEIGAAGLHNILMIGPPGTGKTMLAKCLPGILPPMSREEAMELFCVYSVAGLLQKNGLLKNSRPVVEVHHTTTDIALSGGGIVPKPGMISLAHKGVLFADEMPEFSRRALEVLRQPLEERVIHIARNGMNVTFPADFMLVGALNPCPCGMYPDMKRCTCTEMMRKKYIGRLSKPLVDRMDLCLQVLRPTSGEILSDTCEESSAEVRKRVIGAQKIQQERYKGSGIFFNSQMGIDEIDKYCQLGPNEKDLVTRAIEKYDLSARAYHRILRSARTIADLEGAEQINVKHLSEAIFFKSDILNA